MVYLSWPGQRLRGFRARNLSEHGAFVEIDRPLVPSGTVVRLVFVLEMGMVTRLHCVRATVRRVAQGGVGLQMLGRCNRIPGRCASR